MTPVQPRDKPLGPFVAIFHSLDSQKCQTQEHGQSQADHDSAPPSVMGEMHGQGDGQTAAKKDCGIDPAEGVVKQVSRGVGEGFGVSGPIHRESGE